jgi:cytochrome c oxidase subunit 1
MGITYWLVPHLVGRALWSRGLALKQVWLWTIGMTVFSASLHGLGMQGMPRRTMISMATYIQPEWHTQMLLVGIGGSVMFISALIFFLNVVLTWGASRHPAPEAPAFAEALSGAEEAPIWLDRLRPWLVLSAILILVAYGPILIDMVGHGLIHVRGFRVW